MSLIVVKKKKSEHSLLTDLHVWLQETEKAIFVMPSVCKQDSDLKN